MVSKKRLHYGGLDGFCSPVVPKAPRSIRRNSHKKSSSGSEICAFELLAAVAGKLLQESEGSASSSPDQKEQIDFPKDNVKQEPLEVKLKPARLDDLDQGCYAESQFIPEPSKLEPQLKDPLHSDNDSGLEHASVVTTSDFFREIGTNVKFEASDFKNIVVGTPSKSEGGSPSNGDLCDVNMDTDLPKLIEKETENLQDTCVNHRVLNKSYSSVHLPFYSDHVPSACFPMHKGSNVKIGKIRDDDENSFSCNHYNTKMKAFRIQSRNGYRRIRKMLNSKYWKTAPKLKDYELSHTTCGGNGLKPFNYNKKNMYKRERCQTEAAFRKRKLFHHNSSKPEYVEETSSESISNSPERHPSKRVKFSIKSFKVPELYLEMPETSTVGSLKRSVMEALTAILGGELHVGVLVQGKKIRDDNRTLQQTGISSNSDTLGFMLEPTLPEPPHSPLHKQPPPPPMSPQSDNHQPLSTSPESPTTDAGSVGPPPETNMETEIEKSKEEIVVDTKAIVPLLPITAVNPEALSVVPMNNQKLSKKCELSQRRTRRPFSVSEVEALVEAVETLGTGRWRDVKIRAFDDANHRTYVDLKDKWKTLVHTASISPQQRRGEPVPQNLLDRVLAAHAFWLQHQSKQQVKHQSEPLKVCLELQG